MLLVQELVSGVSVGSIYAILALALVVIFRAAGVGCFAQGSLATLSAFIAWDLERHGVAAGPALALALVASFGVGALLYIILIQRLEKGKVFALVFSTFGLYIGLEGLIGLIWGYTPVSPESLFSGGSIGPKDLGMTTAAVGTLVVSALSGCAMYLLFAKTKIGLAMRAVVTNRESSRLVGISVGRTLMFGWGLSCVIGGIAGILAAPTLYLQPSMLDSVLLYAFAGAVLGGVTSYLGAVVGSVLFGVIQALVGAYVPGVGGNLSLLVALGLIWVVLLVRPQGIFGAHAEHVPW